MARRKEIDRDRVLDAAEAVIMETGGRHFTQDAVAARAGISKGGLVYSFPTKDALIAAALERELARFMAAVELRAEPGRKLIAHLEEAQSEEDQMSRKSSFLMTALVHAPDMASPARGFYKALFGLFDPSTEAGRECRQAVLAVEGLFLLRGMGFADVPAEEWKSVLGHALATLRRVMGADAAEGLHH